jgi:TPR repeat protein
MPGSSTPPIEKPMTGVGDISPVSAAQNSASPSTGTAGNNSQPGNQASPAAPAQAQASTTPPAAEPPATNTQAADEQPTTSKQTTPAEEPAAAKQSKPAAKETVAGSDADRLEAEGEKYLYGDGGSISCSRAETDLQAAAGQGNGKADSVLGTMYATGHCVGRDLPLAYRWFAKALQLDPNNARLQRDLQVLWNQMSGDERQIAMRTR